MDSSRSGLLSTLLMTLPLIIVPAIALLRPAGGPSGVSQTIARGSESPGDASGDELDIEMLEGFDKSLTDAPEFNPEESNDVRRPRKDSGIDDLLPDSSPTPGAPKKLKSTLPESSEAIGRDPFQQLGSNESPTDTPQNQPAGADVDTATEASIRQLQALGAIRTLWFVPGTTTSHGFAAFFRGETELVRYRFEATGPTRSGCVEDVLQQVRQWRNQSARNTQPLD
ncbi:MAG: hypothetical protein ACK5YX_02245 [Planctomyces sp.]